MSGIFKCKEAINLIIPGIFSRKYVHNPPVWIFSGIAHSGFRNIRHIRHIFLESTFVLFYTYGYLFELKFALLTFGDKGVRVLAGPFLRSKILWYA